MAPISRREEISKVAGWDSSGHGLYIFDALPLPCRLFRIDVASGKRELIKELTPADRAGVRSIDSVVVTPDLRTYGYVRFR